MLRERIVALGRRSARGRVAYLLCELAWRQRAVGMIEGNAIRLPLTQTQLADSPGLTPVSVNRILQAFRRELLITLRRRRLILHAGSLQAISELSAAESGHALALIKGKKLCDIAADTGLQITTLRTQLSSILKKVGAERQVALILSSIPVVGL